MAWGLQLTDNFDVKWNAFKDAEAALIAMGFHEVQVSGGMGAFVHWFSNGGRAVQLIDDLGIRVVSEERSLLEELRTRLPLATKEISILS